MHIAILAQVDNEASKALPFQCIACTVVMTATMEEKPSVSRVRRQRQKCTRHEGYTEIQAMKEQIANLQYSVDKLTSIVAKSQDTIVDMGHGDMQFPPGLTPSSTMEHSKQLAERVNLLERFFVLVDFEAIEEVARNIVAKSRSREPEVELSPDARHVDIEANKINNVTFSGELPEVPSWPNAMKLVAASPPPQGAQAQQSQASGSEHKQNIATLLPALEECCEHSSQAASEAAEPVDQYALHPPTIEDKLKMVLDKLDSSRLLNSEGENT